MKRLIQLSLILVLSLVVRASAEHEGKIQILLIGDSTAEGSIPRRHVPEGPHLEQVIEQLLAAEGDLPPYTASTSPSAANTFSDSSKQGAIRKLPQHFRGWITSSFAMD